MGLKLRFSKRDVAAIPVPAAGRTVVHDTECPHLCVRVSATGHRVYYFYAWVRGRPTRIKLGSTDVLPPERAREMASKMGLAKVAGKDPAEERRARKAEPTIQDLFDRWLDIHGKPNLRTWKESERVYRSFFGQWARRKLSEIKLSHVAARHAEIGNGNGPYAANRALALLRALFNKAESLVGWSGPNPARGIEKFKERKRERFLDVAEVRALVAAMEREDALWLAYFTCALWTGQRQSSLTRMRWQDVSLEQAMWIVPAEFSKNGRLIPVALLPPAVEALRSLAMVRTESPWVFASRSKTGHITEVKGAWRRLKARAGITDPTVIPYTLRHSVASHLGMSGANQAIIGAVLGHADSGTSARYTHLDTGTVRAALAGISAKLLESPKGSDNGS